MKYKETFTQTPNISKTVIFPSVIVLHHSVGSFNSLVNTVLNPASKVSYHCAIDLDGSRRIFAKDNQRAWHAGKSTFRNMPNCNNYSLGLAFSGDTYWRNLTLKEVDSACEWINQKMCFYNIPLRNITTHRHIAPDRKTDISKVAYNTILEHFIKYWYGNL